MGYNFYGFTSTDFEDLVQAIFQKILGNGSIIFGLGADGGRELSYFGKANFGSNIEMQDGLWIVQAKFKSRDINDKDQYTWVRTQFLKEMKKFNSGKYPVPQQYIFVTNCVLTPTLERGGRDKMDSLIEIHKDLIPQIHIIAYDELCKLILNNSDVRQAFSCLLLPGDELAEIKKLLTRNNFNKELIVADKEIREIPTKQSNATCISGKLILNIDFGTSFSLCSVFNAMGEIMLVPNSNGSFLLKSIVSFFTNGFYIVGNQTLRMVDSKEIFTVADIKRELGTGRYYKIFGNRYTAEIIASLIVKSLKCSAEEYFGFEFTEAIVSKPSNYNVPQTKALHYVFEKAGLKVLRMVDEGSSPSFLFPKVINEYRLHKNNINFLVIDLGGGTFDISIQEYGDEVLETIAVLGDNYLGGIDYDRAVLKLVSDKMGIKYPILRNVDFSKYLIEAERVKKELTDKETCSFIIADYESIDGNLMDLSVTLSKNEFRECTSSLNTKVMQYLTKIGQIAKDKLPNKTIPKIDAIMLTGQGSKIFTIKEIIANLFPNIPVIDKYMENAVCLGNSYQSGVISGYYNADLTLNVQNTSLVIMGCKDAIWDKVNKHTRVPIVFNPIMNTVRNYLIKGSTLIPCVNKFLLELSVTSNQGLFSLPIYEISNSDSKHEEVSIIKVPVSIGLNKIELQLDINASSKIFLHVKNDLMSYSEIHTII